KLKWGHFDPRDTFGYGMWKEFILMRLGETYLLKAEAQFLQGNTSGAAATINILRDRAQAPTVAGSDIDLNFILDERARELLAEENQGFCKSCFFDIPQAADWIMRPELSTAHLDKEDRDLEYE